MRHISLITALATALCIAMPANALISNKDLSLEPKEQTKQIIALIKNEFAGEPQSVIETTVRIAMCESGPRRYGRPAGIITHLEKDGSVQKGDIDSRDTGAFQINPATHSRAWRKANPFNPREITDNVAYARALQKDRIRAGQYRFADWIKSKSCWG